MKKFSILLTLAVLMVSSSVFAGSIDYLSNQSAKYLMTFTRNASTEASADIANYNPAGTAFLAEGFYIDVSNQTLFKPYKTETNINAPTGSTVPNDLEQSQPTWLLPNVYVAYNFGQIGAGKLAAYAHVGISAGGGSLDWEDGTHALYATLAAAIFGTVAPSLGKNSPMPAKTQSFEASSVYYTAHIGAAYAFLDDMLSVSLGGKAIMAERSMKIEAVSLTNQTLSGEFEYEATGYTPVIGIDVKPLKELTIAARYENKTSLKFKYDQKELTATGTNGGTDAEVLASATNTLKSVGIYDGKKSNNDLPAILALGAEYQATPELAVMTSANIYFLSKANMGKAYTASSLGTGSDEIEVNKFFGTGYEISLGAKYLVMPELKVGMGFIYTESGAKDKYFNDQRTWLNCAGNPPLDSWTIGLGGSYTVIENLDLTLAGAWTHYLPEKYAIKTASGVATGATGEYNKDVYNIGVGVGYKI